jgi:hypothetical protein
MKRVLLLSIVLISMFSASAQVNQSLRREFPVGVDFDNFTIAPFNELGMIIFGSDRISLSTTKWKFTKVDQDLKSIDSVTFDLPSQLSYTSFSVSDNKLVVLFTSIKRGTYRISIIDFNTMKVKNLNGNTPKRSYNMRFRVCGKTAYISLYSKRKPVLFTINLESGASKQNPILIKNFKKTWIEGIEVDTASREIFLFVGYWMKSKHTGMQVHLWNEDGKQIETFSLTNIKDHNLTAISGSRIAQDHYMFTGTYAKKSLVAVAGEGFFIAEMLNGERTFLKYYNFLDLDEFTSYLSKRKQDKIEKKKAKKEARGGSLSYIYLMAPHSVLSMNDHYYFLGEFFYPTYRTVTTTTYVNGKPQTRVERVFDGYQYTHAAVICFDRSGNKIWDATFEMWLPYKPMYIERFVTMMAGVDGRVDLLYATNNAIVSKSINAKGKVLNERSSTGVETGGEDDKVKRSVTWMRHWYDDHFLAYGVQKIKDKGKTDGKKVRRVFFVNKVTPE